MLHYGVWIVALPWLAVRQVPWKLAQTPLARRSVLWRRSLMAVCLVGVLAALGLWAGFLADYGLTRDLYFTWAMIHVLAEVPFLLRIL